MLMVILDAIGNKHSQLLFPYCSNKCHAAYEVFNFLHLSVHVPAAPNMVKERVSNKAS